MPFTVGSSCGVVHGVCVPSCRAFAVDVTSPEAVNAAVAEVLAQAGHIDILVNCAGITGTTNIKSHEVSLDDYDRVMKVNAQLYPWELIR